MTDAETLARLRASDLAPGEFLDALEAVDEPIHPDEYKDLRDERDVWRVSCVASWGFWLLTMLVVFWGNS